VIVDRIAEKIVGIVDRVVVVNGVGVIVGTDMIVGRDVIVGRDMIVIIRVDRLADTRTVVMLIMSRVRLHMGEKRLIVSLKALLTKLVEMRLVILAEAKKG
jgi:hypothetical protein